MAGGDEQKKISEVPKVPRVNQKKKQVVDTADATAKVLKLSVDASPSKPHTDEATKNLADLAVVTQSEASTSSHVVVLNGRPTGWQSCVHRPHDRDILFSGSGSIEEGTNIFLLAEGEVIFILVFEDSVNTRVLMTHKGFRHSSIATCLVSDISLPQDEVKLNQMTTSELNQFVGGEYKVIEIQSSISH